MTANASEKDSTGTAAAANEQDMIAARKTLSKERFRFGIVNVLYQGEEGGLLAIHTVIIRALGGSAVHLGICAAIGIAVSLGQWLGAFFLKKYNSNRKAMTAALWVGALCALLVCGSILLGYSEDFKAYSLWLYLLLVLGLISISGIILNIEISWIGDLVAKPIRGWFTSLKYIIGILGGLFFSLFFGKLVDVSPHLSTYAWLFVVVAISHIIGIFMVAKIKDCIPKNANFISAGASHHERLNYASLPLWCYAMFFILWSCGRMTMTAFSTAYLIDYFHYSITKIAVLLAISKITAMILLFVMGKTSDKYGNRIPLLLISGTVALSMMLWVVSAWWGILPVIVYQFINGAAGHTHSMLGINYGLEIFPAKGRAGYFGFSNILVGLFTLLAPIIGGNLMHTFEGFNYLLWGTEINHYHVFFACCSLISFSSIIPLLIAGKRVVPERAG